jgi:hypothetical protein
MSRQAPPPPEIARLALPIVAIGAFTLSVGAAVAASAAQATLGFDFLAYHAAASRVLSGGPLYDMSFAETGGFGLFYYPPTFGPLVLPLGLLPETVAVWAWTALLVAAFAAGVALLPVPTRLRWLVLLLGGLSWPVAYAIKLGQVGPILFLAFVIGWRWLGDPVRFGASAAIGAAIKIQPGLVLAWALLAGRFRAVVVGAIVLAVLAILATIIAGTGSWSDFLTLVVRVSDPITTPHNFTPGAVAYQLGVPRDVAALLQAASTVLSLLVVLVIARRASPIAGYQAAIVASQLVSPVLWDHYAMLLLVPVAWLVSIGWRWAALVPLLTPVVLLPIVPAVVYPVAFWVTLAAVLGAGLRRRADEAAA